MEKIKIFENKKIEIDLNNLLDTRSLICANSGGGKSYTVRKILEESNNKVMSIVLDVEGEFRTLREKYPDLLLIGEDGDIPLSMQSADLLPKKLLDLNISTIIDISELKKHDRVRYVKKFIDSLMELPRKYWKPCFIFVDEIHSLAGQQEKQDSTFAVIDLATRGRKRGYCLIGCTQRISKLHKDVVAELNNYFVGRTSLDIDMKRASDLLGFSTKQDMLSLRDLDDGEFYVFGPAISKRIRKEKVAKTKTTHPKRGQISAQEIISPTTKVKNLLLKLSDLPKEAEEELKNINDYKKKIVELKRELHKLSRVKVVDNKVEYIVDSKKLEKARIEGFNECKQSMTKEVNFLRKENNLIIGRDEKIAQLLSMPLPPRPEYKPQEIKPMAKLYTSKDVQQIKKIQHVTNQSPISYESDTNGALGICARKIYSFLFANPGREFTKPQVSFMTGYSISGNFNNAIYSLTAQNLIEKKGDLLVLGESNPEIATEKQEEFRKELFTKRLPIASQKIFEILWEDPHTEYSKHELSEQTGYSISGNFNNAIYKLTGLKFAIKHGTSIKLNPEILELE